MPAENYITASCVISDKVVYKNGLAVFADKDADFTSFLISAYRHFECKYPKFFKMDNLSRFGMLASEVLLKPRFLPLAYNPEEIGVVLANASSSLDTDIKYFQTVSDMASPAMFVYTLPNIMIGEICIRNGFKGENAFFIFNRFNADFIKNYVNNLLNADVVKVCICGWVELLEDRHYAVLFLIEKITTGINDLFTTENINKIYEKQWRN